MSSFGCYEKKVLFISHHLGLIRSGRSFITTGIGQLKFELKQKIDPATVIQACFCQNIATNSVFFADVLPSFWRETLTSF